MKNYKELIQDILENGVTKADRTGTGTISVFGKQLRWKMNEGFPLMTIKKVSFHNVLTELLFFLQGRIDLRYLLQHNNSIWVGDAYKRYEQEMQNSKHGAWFDKDAFIDKILTNDAFSNKWGDLGKIYGYQWRKWSSRRKETSIESDAFGEFKAIDQIANLVHDLKTNPDSRRLMVTAWNPAELNQQILPPCHYGFQVYTTVMKQSERLTWYRDNSQFETIVLHDRIEQEMDAMKVPTRKISLAWNHRSVDTALGLPYNIASYGLLLHILGKMVNMVPDELIGNLGDTHLYLNHVEYAKEIISRWNSVWIPLLPTVELKGFDKVSSVDDLTVENFELRGYTPLGTINAALSN